MMIADQVQVVMQAQTAILKAIESMTRALLHQAHPKTLKKGVAVVKRRGSRPVGGGNRERTETEWHLLLVDTWIAQGADEKTRAVEVSTEEVKCEEVRCLSCIRGY